jgi:MFS family permease
LRCLTIQVSAGERHDIGGVLDVSTAKVLDAASLLLRLDHHRGDVCHHGEGALGYGLTSIMGAVVVEIFQGRRYGSIFGTIMVAALAGGAAGPLVTGLLHHLSGSYTLAFLIGIGVSGLSALAIWMASPGKIRAVAGRLHRIPA